MNLKKEVCFGLKWLPLVTGAGTERLVRRQSDFPLTVAASAGRLEQLLGYLL